MYILSIMFYIFLLLPILGFLVLKNSYKFQSLKSLHIHIDSTKAKVDSLNKIKNYIEDSLLIDIENINDSIIANLEIDSIITKQKKAKLIKKLKTLNEKKESEEDNMALLKTFNILFSMIAISFFISTFFAIPFKIFFRRKRRNKKINKRINKIVRNIILKTPAINTFIFGLPYIVMIIFMALTLESVNNFDDMVEYNLYAQVFYIAIVSTILILIFIYFWQKHRVHNKYIEFVYTKHELKKSIFNKKSGKIRNRLLLSTLMTTFLPLAVVFLYLFLSLTPLNSLKIKNLNSDHKKIILGEFYDLFYTLENIKISEKKDDKKDKKKNNIKIDYEGEKFLTENGYYVNSINTYLMLMGIINGISLALIYILFFVNWSTKSIVMPIKELLIKIQKTKGQDMDNFAIVRTNDEIGKLTEGFNNMTERIYDFVLQISQMNAELEDKVKERTAEISQQKEEIETQRDAIIEQKNEIETQRDFANDQKDLIVTQNVAITDSIQYASNIQKAILPPNEYIKKLLPNSFVFFKPRDIVSGDFYWISEKHNKIIVAIADCTGHGVPGAFMSMLGTSFLREIVDKNSLLLKHSQLKADNVLNKLRHLVIESLHQTGKKDEAKDGMDIALCIIDKKNKKIEYAGAHNPLYIIRKGVFIEYKADKMPIGTYRIEEEIPFTNKTIEIETGDSIYMFTDGYLDQFGGHKLRKFMIPRFQKMLLSIYNEDLSKQHQIIKQTLDKWMNGTQQIDDILVFGAKI